MIGVAQSRARLAALTALTGVPVLFLSWLTMSQSRYPVWRMVERTIWESTALAVITAVPSAALLCRAQLSGRLLWANSRHRAALSAFRRLVLAHGLAAAAGWLLGLSPLLVWSAVRANTGILPWWALGVVGVYLMAIVGLTLALIRGVGTVWVAVIVVLIHILAFFRGRSLVIFEPGEVPTAPFPLVPFDGLHLIMEGEIGTSSTLRLMRVLGVLLLVAAGALAVTIAHRSTGPVGLLRQSITSPLFITVLLVAGLTTWQRVPIPEVQPSSRVCGGSGPQVCIWATHADDLGATLETVHRLTRSIGPDAIPSPVIAEAGEKPMTPVWVRISSLRTDTPPQLRIAEQLGDQLAGLETCVTRRPLDQSKLAAGQAIATWLERIASGVEVAPTAPEDKPLLHRWAQDPRAITDFIRQHGDAVAKCEVPYERLP